MAAVAVTAASRLTLMMWPKSAVPAVLQMDATPAAVRVPVVLAAVAARRVTVPTAAADNRTEAKAGRTLRRTVGRAAVEMAASVVLVAMVARTWCQQSTTRRSLSARPAEQVSRLLPGVVVAAAAVGLARCSWPVVAAVAQAQAVPLVAGPSVAVVAAVRLASMLLALTAS
jgi:hypothetical protein